MANQDSPLSITSSVAGILTFVAAIAAAIYVRFTYLRNADSEYFQVKTSLSWYKTESAWLHDLVHAADGPKARSGNEMEYQMYVFVMEQLGKLEERLLELVTEVETSSASSGESKRWTLVPKGMIPRTSIAMSWVPVREKALELVRQREALGARVLFTQMSMMSSRVRDQESRAKQKEEINQERLHRLEKMVCSQHEKLDRLETLVYRVMHRDRIASEAIPLSEIHQPIQYRSDDSGSSTSIVTEDAAQDILGAGNLGASTIGDFHKPVITSHHYPISESSIYDS